MAANHTNHEALSDRPLDPAASESDLLEDIEEMLMTKMMIMFKELVKPTEFQNSFLETDAFYDGTFSGELNAASSNMEQDAVSAFSELTDSHLWSQDVTLMHSSPTMDSHSTITDADWAAGSPAVSANIIEGSHNQANAASSGSLCEQSDVDDKAAATDKRQRRRILNNESARISRTRKRAQLLGLEWQAQNLKTENATLYKQLTDSWLQFYDANTNNRILKSNVEALRAKVKLAEDMISRINNQLVQNQSQLSTATQMISDVSSVGRMAHVSAANIGHENDASYGDMVLDQFGNPDIFSNFNM